MATLALWKGKKARYKIEPVVAAGHAALLNPIKLQTSVTSNGCLCPCPADLAPSAQLAADLLAAIKTAVAAAVPAGATLKTDKYAAEFWMNEDHLAVEDSGFTHPTVTWPADGPVPARDERPPPVSFSVSAAIKAALKTECDAAVAAMLAL